MSRTNADCGAWVADRLEVGPDDSVLEVGFGPGVVLQRLSTLVPAGRVAGIDPSQEMVGQARARNAAAIEDGRVELWLGSVSACHSMRTASMRRWRSTRCKSGRTPSPGYVRSVA
ncbi:class I SAM-dependent methyltransferase [Bradyrhizobium sp. USDA 4515]